MTRKVERLDRQRTGEEVVSVLAKQALLAGATLEQLERETGQAREEIQRLLDQLEAMEKGPKGGD